MHFAHTGRVKMIVQKSTGVGAGLAPRRGSSKALSCLAQVPAGEGGSSSFLIRWFSLAGSLYHRLISVAPPASLLSAHL